MLKIKYVLLRNCNANTYRNEMYMLKHIVLSQKNADRKKKCMETAEMIKRKNLYHSFCTIVLKTFALKVDRKKCAKSLEIINPIRRGKKDRSRCFTTNKFGAVTFIVLITCATGHNFTSSLLYLLNNWSYVPFPIFCCYFNSKPYRVSSKRRRTEKNFSESLLYETQTKFTQSKQKFNLF